MIQEQSARRRVPYMVVVLGTLLALVGAILPLTATPAAAVTPGCSVATATPLSLGTANTITTVCPDERYYNYVDLKSGDVLTIDFDARGLLRRTSFYLLNPGVTDFTLADAYTVGYKDVRTGTMSQQQDRVYESGRFIIQWKSGGRGMVFSPHVSAVAPSAGRVSGACRIESAPTAPNGVVQYSDSASCDPEARTWKLAMTAGNLLSLQVDSLSGSGLWSDSSLYVYEPGVTDFTLGQTKSWCYVNIDGRATASCGKALKSGAYIIRHTSGRASFKPIVTRLSAPSAPRAVVAAPAPGSAKVRWTAPASLGGSAVNAYVVKAIPGGRTCTTAGATACTVTGLTPGASYRFTVSARNGVGWSAASPASGVVKPWLNVTKARIWTYKKASRLELDVDPNRGWEWRVQLQKLKKGKWVKSGKAKTTIKTHRKFNPKRGTYRVVVFGKNGHAQAASNAVYIRK